MSTWDTVIFSDTDNEEFLDELVDLDDQEIVEAIRDACLLAVGDAPSPEERSNGLAAATVAAIWAGAPFTAGDAAERFPFLRDLDGAGDEELRSAAAELLESVESEDGDVEQFLEALS